MGWVRLCCGQMHDGPMCPDGLVMCVLCFERVPESALNMLDDGCREDVCASCAEAERAEAERRAER